MLFFVYKVLLFGKRDVLRGREGNACGTVERMDKGFSGEKVDETGGTGPAIMARVHWI